MAVADANYYFTALDFGSYGREGNSYVQGAAEWTAIFQRVIKNERNKLQKKSLYFRTVLTI